MRVASAVLIVLILMSGVGCAGVLLPPGGEKFYNQARGDTGLQTALSLTIMMEESIRQAKAEPVEEVAGLTDLHAQLFALHRAFDEMTDLQASRPASITAVTLRKDLVTVFYRLGRFREDRPLRDLHLDLVAVRLQELRQALQAVE